MAEESIPEVVQLEQALSYVCPACTHVCYYHAHEESPEHLQKMIQERTGTEIPLDALPPVSKMPQYVKCPSCKRKYTPTMDNPQTIVIGGYDMLADPQQGWIKSIREAGEFDKPGRTIDIRIDGPKNFKDDRDLPNPKPGFFRLIMDLPQSELGKLDYVSEAGGISPARLYIDVLQQAYQRVKAKIESQRRDG